MPVMYSAHFILESKRLRVDTRFGSMQHLSAWTVALRNMTETEHNYFKPNHKFCVHYIPHHFPDTDKQKDPKPIKLGNSCDHIKYFFRLHNFHFIICIALLLHIRLACIHHNLVMVIMYLISSHATLHGTVFMSSNILLSNPQSALLSCIWT